MIEEFNVDSKAEIQLYLAHVARKKETKTIKRQWPFNSKISRLQSVVHCTQPD